MLQALQLLAAFCTALFAGAALYINAVEHPARMRLETRAAAMQWAPSYKRATGMQAPLALASFVAGVAAWWVGGALGWLISGLLMGAVVLFTFIAVMPANKRLLEPQRDLASRETRALLEGWNRLHAVRTGLSLIALALDLWLLTA